ncbi:MAG: hypothetical protein NVS4B8_25120 [Herpetosiphon sp.]
MALLSSTVMVMFRANNQLERSLLGFAAGLCIIIAYNVRSWKVDKKLISQLHAEAAVQPVLAHRPRVSVLVAAWNERRNIDAHLCSFLALTYQPIELIICAGGVDGTAALARRYASEQVIVLEQQPGDGKQHSLARCIEHAHGDVIYFTDADCVYQDDALMRILAPITNSGEHVVTGISRPLDTQLNKVIPASLWASDTVSAARKDLYTTGLLGRNAAVTRSALDQIGGLNFKAPTGTDYHLAQHLVCAGFAIRHIPASIVPSQYPETLSEYRRKQSRWLRNLLIYGWRYNAKWDMLVTARTMAVGISMLLAPLALPKVGRRLFVVWLVLVAHAIVSRLRYLTFTDRLYRRSCAARVRWAVVPMTFVDFTIWGLSVTDLFTAKRSTRW